MKGQGGRVVVQTAAIAGNGARPLWKRITNPTGQKTPPWCGAVTAATAGER